MSEPGRRAPTLVAAVALALGATAWAAPGIETHPLLSSAAYLVVVLCCALVALGVTAAAVDESEFGLRLAVAPALATVVAGSVATLLGFVGLLDLPPLLTLLGASTWVLGRRNSSGWVLAGLRGRRRVLHELPVALALAFFAVVWLLEAAHALRYTPQESDAMWYHLPMVAHWVQSGAIEPSDAIALIARAYPGLRQAALATLTLPLGNEHLALLGLVELPAFFLALWMAARRAGANSSLALSIACYSASMPVVLRATRSQGTDLSLAAFTLLGFVLLRDALSAVDVRKWLLAGLMLGAASALKYSGPIYATLVVLTCALEFFLARPRAQWAVALRPRGWTALALAAGCIAGPWYGRNVVRFGNPLFPAPLLGLPSPLERADLAAKTLGWNLEPLLESWRHFPQANGWFAPLLFAAPLVLLALIAARRRSAEQHLALVLLSAASFAAFLQQPFNHPSFEAYYNMRYLIGWSALSLVALAALARSSGLAHVVLVGALTNLWQVSRWTPLLAVTALVAAFAARWAASRELRLAPRPGVARLVAALLLVVALGAVHAAAELRARLQFDPGYGYRDSSSDRGWAALGAWVHEHVSGAAVGVHGDPRVFPYYGDRLDNRVVTLDARASTSQVAAAAFEQGLDWLVCIAPVVGRSSAREFEFGESIAPALLRAYPGRFVLERESRGSHLLRVVR